MKNLIIKAVLVASIAFSSVFSLATNSAYATAISSFTRTCEKISVNSGILSATCKQPDGQSQNTQIDLNKYIGNSGGNLSWDGTNFSNSCSGVSLDNDTLVAECKKINGYRQSTKISLIERIENKNGNLDLISSSQEKGHIYSLENGDDWFYFEDQYTTGN